jgi:chorismate mutase / prephenate dehydrogenase
MSDNNQADFDKVRQEIDQVDNKLVELIGKRLELTGEVGRLKAKLNLPLYVPTREAEIISHKRQLAKQNGISEDLIEDVIRRIMRESYSSQTATRNNVTVTVDKKILIVGGAGQLGALFARLFVQSGYNVDVLEKDDWGVAEEKLKAASLVMVAVPIRVTEQVIAMLTNLNPECVLIDITSLKSKPLDAMMKVHQGPVVGLHPMFGPGIKTLAKQTIVVCHGRMEQKYQWLIEQLQSWGAKISFVESQQHDKLMSIIQVFRHFSTVAHGYHLKEENINLDEVLELSSPIYRLELIMVGRLFAQNPELYSDIIFAEKSNIPMIRRFIERFTDLLDLLEAQDDKRFTELFNEVSKWFGEHAKLFLQESNLMLAKANDIRK